MENSHKLTPSHLRDKTTHSRSVCGLVQDSKSNCSTKVDPKLSSKFQLKLWNSKKMIARILKIHKSSPLQYLVHTIFSSSSYHSSALAAAAALPSSSTSPSSIEVTFQSKDVIHSFKEWFKTGKDDLLDRIFVILNTHDEVSADISLSGLNLPLNEILVLEVFNYSKDVLSCLKFFDWAGRQQGFVHTRATFNAIYKILSRKKLMFLMLDFLENYRKKRYLHTVRFDDTLVMGYAIAGKPEVALQLYGRMRYKGIDLDGFAYHVLLNALVEESYFEAVNDIAKQIRLRGHENEITHSIVVKYLCKQKLLDEGEEYLRDLVRNGGKLTGHIFSVLIDAFCKNEEFERAGRFMEEFTKLGVVSMEQSYNIWIGDLVRAGKLDDAMDLVKSKKFEEGYVPDVFRYNGLIFKLLKENRLEEVLDLLMEMKESEISPDQFTMNTTLCFFCKAGMIDVVLELYNTREEFNLSPNSMAYNYLINTLCGEGNIDEAYKVLKSCIEQGHLPGAIALSILSQNLHSDKNIDTMMELFLAALEYSFIPSWASDIFISALCKAERFEDCYVLYQHLVRLNKAVGKRIYYDLIRGFNKTNRGDIAASIVNEMLEMGHKPIKQLFREIIVSISKMDNPEARFCNLLETLLNHYNSNCRIYNIFIDGAGHARRHDLAQLVFGIMVQRGVVPDLHSDIFLLKSYLRSSKFSDALNWFSEVSDRRKIGRKLYSVMIVGLCKENKAEIALDILREMRGKGIVPGIQCYEELVKALCLNEQFDSVIHLVEDLDKCGRTVSSFIGNVLLYHLLEKKEPVESWFRFKEDDARSSSFLSRLVSAVSCLRVNDGFDELEKPIQSCFQPDIYTYNLLLRRLSRSDIDLACKYFSRLRQKGYKPNRWSYHFLAHGLLKHGRIVDGKRCIDEMRQNGFFPTKTTERLVYRQILVGY